MAINIAIDGPSAAGKSTIADDLANRLGYVHLDTGAMYRAIGLKCLTNNLDFNDEQALVEIAQNIDLQMNPDGTIIMDGNDVTNAIRENEVSMAASNCSKYKGVRAAMVKLQQAIAKDGGYILDGRDIGTVVLPDAPVKIYMVASAEARAQRRVLQNIKKGIKADYDEILADIQKRDYQDSNRENSPLKKADDAILIDTSNLTAKQVADEVMVLVNRTLGD